MDANPVVLITGGGRGLGRAFALALAQTGAHVAVTARSESEVAQTAALIEQAGGRALALPADVTDQQAVARVVAAVERQLGPIEVLINNAGRFQALGPVAQVDPDDWWREVEINLRGPFLCARAVLPGMMARGHGRILNIASGAGLEGIETISAYGASKTALIRFTETLAIETQPYGVAVLAVGPGTVRTPLSDHGATSPQVRARAPMVQQWFQHLFEEGLDTPIEQAVELVVALASGRADALSGCFLDVDDDLEALIVQAEAIRREQRLTLRLRTV